MTVVQICKHAAWQINWGLIICVIESLFGPQVLFSNTGFWPWYTDAAVRPASSLST